MLTLSNYDLLYLLITYLVLHYIILFEARPGKLMCVCPFPHGMFHGICDLRSLKILRRISGFQHILFMTLL